MALAVTDGGTAHSVERGPVDLPRDRGRAVVLLGGVLGAEHHERRALVAHHLIQPARLALITLHQKEQTDPDGAPFLELPRVA